MIEHSMEEEITDLHTAMTTDSSDDDIIKGLSNPEAHNIPEEKSDSKQALPDDDMSRTVSFSIIKFHEETTEDNAPRNIVHPDGGTELENVRRDLEEQKAINEQLMRKIEELEKRENEWKQQNDPMEVELDTESADDKPMKFAIFLVKYPCVVIVAVLLVTIITFAIDIGAFDLVDAGGMEYFITSAEDTGRMYAYWAAVSDAQGGGGNAMVKTQEMSHYQIISLFKTTDGSDILQPQYLPFIKEVHDKIVNWDYNEYYRLCLSDTTSFPNCSSMAVTDPLIDGLVGSKSIADVSQEDIDGLVSSRISAPAEEAAQFFIHFASPFANSTDSGSQYYRAFFKFGFPYPDIDATTSSFQNKDDRMATQQKFYEKWVLPIWRDIQFENNYGTNIEVVLAGGMIDDLGMLEMTQAAMGWTTAAMLVVYFILTVHLESLFLSTAAMGQILLGFPISYFLYGVVFQITYFGTLHTLIIFVILGIAADDCFVFNDAWIQSELMVEDPDDVIERMSYTLWRATTAMGITSATTFIAFLATYFSPIMPISSFGVWAGTVVLINYSLVITYFPAMVAWHHHYVKKHERCPAFCGTIKLRIQGLLCGKEERKKAETRRESLAIPDKASDDPSEAKQLAQLAGDQPVQEKGIVRAEAPRQSRATELFLRDKWSKWMIKGRFFILAGFSVLVSIAVWQTSKLEPQNERIKFFDDDHFMEKMKTWQDEFAGGNVGGLMDVELTWGMEPHVDRKGLTRWDVVERGRVIWDEVFDLSPMDAQQHVFGVCQALMASDKVYNPSQHLDCFLYDLIDYADQTRGLSFPFNFSSDAATQRREFNLMVEKWVSSDPKGMFHINSGDVGMKHNELVFIAIGYQLDFFQFAARDIKKAEYDFWEKQIGEWNEAAPESVSGAFQSGIGWAWMASENAFTVSAIQGMSMALPAAFVVLVLATGNWIISALAVFTVICILTTETMLMVLQGWKLGISESVSVVVMIGFSIDYVVHYAASYVECEVADRNGRIRHALHTMGISIVSGAFTTFASGVFLIIPEFKFFGKFGILIMSIVAFSLVYSNTFFIALLAVLGPEKNSGKLNFKAFGRKMKVCLQDVGAR